MAKIDVVSIFKQHGFKRKVYSDQNGSPVFFTKVFEASEVPKFAVQFEQDNPDESADGIVLEVSEDGSVLQFVAGLDYMEAINPIEDPERAKSILDDFNITTLA